MASSKTTMDIIFFGLIDLLKTTLIIKKKNKIKIK